MTQAYDQKNEVDYERNTEQLHEAITKIRSNKKLKPTIAELVRITGMHRNTIGNREWPKKQLDAIKKDRAREASSKERERHKEQPQDPIKILQGKLDNAQLELVYWFNLYGDMEKAFNQSDKRFRQIRDARDTYKTKWEEERRMRLKADAEIERLNDLLNAMSKD